ncbi:styrene monooxygenase/indole monooxygenase family protein [Fictibacillus enclensis]|uniref:styrene monooxygenase/indole monooxygenase family protein n=1 Tax=Fictibacillus enclensis TaxID=1017270 RepID=UPI0024C0ACB9|nr:styrene monooxygenase/indole monooxygenase family protein [Fictibacillus enclensis]WHY71577.1 styrene monooxygenase [Fictibacillus enclensis]
MKKKVGIIGGGTTGLQLAYALMEDFDVTIISHRTPEQVRSGRIMSTQVHFGPAREREKRFHMPDWNSEQMITSIHITVGDQKLFAGRLEKQALSVDQRLSYSTYAEDLEKKGVTFQQRKITEQDRETLDEEFDLVVDCTGKNGPIFPFPIEKELTPFQGPQRKCIVGYFKGVKPVSPCGVSVTVIPELGEMFEIPAEAESGPVTILFITAVPAGPLDMFKGMKSPEAFTIKMREAVEMFFPEIHSRIVDELFALSDENGFLQVAITPEVRRPYVMEEHQLILGCGDSVVLNDPITGQGCNLSSYCAEQLSELLVEHKHDDHWGEELGILYWNRIKHFVKEVTEWTNAMTQPLPGHVIQMLLGGAQDQVTADQVARWFENPSSAHQVFLAKV